MLVRGTVWLILLALVAAPAANALAQATQPAPGAPPAAQPKSPTPKPPVAPATRPAGEVAGPPAPGATPVTPTAAPPAGAKPAPAVPPTVVPPGTRPAALPPTTGPHATPATPNVVPTKPVVAPGTRPVGPATRPASVPAATKAQPPAAGAEAREDAGGHGGKQLDFMTMLFVFMLATFIGIGVIRRVSRLLHTPLMSLTNAISAIAVVGAIIVAGGGKEYPTFIRVLGAVALFASMTNIISGFLITDRMLKMFKTREGGKS